jgi:hypothetical protein
MQHLGAHAVDDGERDLGAVLRRIDVDAERALAERRVNDTDDCFGDLTGIGVRRNDSGKGFLDFLAITFVRPRFVLGGAVLSAGVPECAK